jgi:hypothetical protein
MLPNGSASGLRMLLRKTRIDMCALDGGLDPAPAAHIQQPETSAEGETLGRVVMHESS